MKRIEQDDYLYAMLWHAYDIQKVINGKTGLIIEYHFLKNERMCGNNDSIGDDDDDDDSVDGDDKDKQKQHAKYKISGHHDNRKSVRSLPM